MTASRPALLAASLLALLSACDDGAPKPEGGSKPAAPAVAPKPADQVRQGLAGVWRPQPAGDLSTLVLEGDGQLYLVGDSHRQGVSWQKGDSGAIRLNYLSRGEDKAATETLTATVDKGTLTLQGDGPFAGQYQRDAQNIETVTGTVVLPENTDIPDHAILAVTLRALKAANADHDIVVNRRLTRLHPDHHTLPFRLYFNRQQHQSKRQYGIDARVIANGAVRLVSAGTQPLPADATADDHNTITLTLHSPDHASK